ncbi:hypothetical protein WKS79_002052 [Providencia stuartii]
MKAKNNKLKFAFMVGILSGITVFLIVMITFLLGKGGMYIFLDIPFEFSFEYVKKASIMGLFAAFLVGIGMWVIEYKKT